SLTTQYSAEQMDSTPELEEKKDFLLMFNLSHVSPQQRKGDHSTAPLQPQPNGHLYLESPSPSPPCSQKHKQNDTLKPSMDSQVSCIPPLLAPHHGKSETTETQSNRKLQVLQNGTAHQKKEPGPMLNGRSRPWERFTPDAFAQRFHQAVLQSTQSTVQSKGVPYVFHATC
ncbi:hypothetical protein XENOCAPTIV_010343, partial [Xenoophorus captivus]